MKQILVELRCPYCGYLTHKKSETLILPAFEPKLREQILNDQFFHQECPCCHKQISFLHPCLYQDGKHQFMIFLQMHDQENTPELHEELNFKKRIVSSSEELSEKIRIFEDGFFDVAIEHIKTLLFEKTKQKVLYHDYDLESNTLWFETISKPSDVMAIDASSYAKIEKRCILDKFDKKFKTINSTNYHFLLKN